MDLYRCCPFAAKITHLHLANAYEVLGLRDKSIEHYTIVARMEPLN
jgi:hypothetical protein